MNLTIISANATKVMSIATAAYWAFAAWIMIGDRISGNWMTKEGLWIVLVLLTGFCGTGFWVMMAPLLIKVFRTTDRPYGARELGKAFWCLSTLPVVLLCLGLVLLLLYYRIIEA
ncbi:hypothetical protein OJ996_10070 [Luteolibacter sp. GHJ8]|uniref:Uncharacterized protein n=1 Tax=Luteolibacter rhizosphaerae TaxID=2989719 RepID=A0ABT3G2N5_9BACT|nr:hypothetical protein [Luteolibacter rhizosphaerae]MCW1913922.1 hypothetical protein [Luteolibacter rhizosphaerae]